MKLGAVEIGRFVIAEVDPLEGRPVVWIGIREGYDGAGEGGTFPIADLERVIAEFYREKF